MSKYDYHDHSHHRRGRTKGPDYVQKGPGNHVPVLHSRDRNDKHFDKDQPVKYRHRSYRKGYDRPRRARSSDYCDRDPYYKDNYYSDYNPRARRGGRTRYDDDTYYSDDYDQVRRKSRGRLQRSRSASSDDSYVPSRYQRYGKRSRSDPSREHSQPQGHGRQIESAPEDGSTRARSNSSPSISTTDLEQRRKKSRGKELLTASLATVATIHAAHGVYNSMAASKKRHKLVMEHKMSPEESRKRKSKNVFQDAAAVGIAALGINSIFSEWKEIKDTRTEQHKLAAHRRRHGNARKRREPDAKEHQPIYGHGNASAPVYGDASPYHAYAGNQTYLPPTPHYPFQEDGQKDQDLSAHQGLPGSSVVRH